MNFHENDGSKSQRAMLLVCKLSGYLLASISKSEVEWDLWCRPFLESIFCSQFGDDLGSKHFQEIDSSFSPIIGKGVHLWIDSISESNESSENSEDSDYIIVRTAEQHLLDEFACFTDEEWGVHLESFAHRFMEFILHQQEENKKNHHSDARVRTMARKLSRMLYGSAQTFRDLETAYFSQLRRQETSNEEQKNENYKDTFREVAMAVPKQSLLVSYRMWRVALVAVGGGALVGATGALAAPTILASAMPLLTASTSFLQLSVVLESYFTYVGVSTVSTTALMSSSTGSGLISTFFATYGALVSGRTMLKRTEELGEFELLPLHIPTVSRLKDNAAAGSNASAFALAPPSNDTSSASLNGGPVYILVPGHMDKNVDLRALWGANGTVLLLDEDQCDTSPNLLTAQPLQKPTTGTTQEVPTASTKAASPTIVCPTDIDVKEGKHIPDVPTPPKTPTTPLPSVAHVVLEHEVHALKTRLVHRLQEEVEHTILPLLPLAPEQKTAVAEEMSRLTESTFLHTERDMQAEADWEQLQLRYQGWWRELITLGEEYVLQWETMLLSQLNDTFYDLLYNELRAQIVGQIKDALLNFAASTLYPLKKSLALPELVLGKIQELDGSWVRAMDRARQAGHLLARTLYHMKNGMNTANNDGTNRQTSNSSLGEKSSNRPVTLIGYGMGARLIFHCLEHLYDIAKPELHGEDVKGIVEHAILLGAPVSTSRHAWRKARHVVADRLVNGYARFDWMLALMYRVKSYEFGVAGLYPVHLHDTGVPRNVSSTGEEPKAVPMISRLCSNTAYEMKMGKQSNNLAEAVVQLLDDDGDVSHDTTSDMKDFESGSERGTSGDDASLASKKRAIDFSAAAFADLQDVENIDLTEVVSVHSDYPKLLYTILNLLKL